MEVYCEQIPDDPDCIQRAIDRCPEDGGTVVVPAGTWQSGPLRLKSNLTLWLEEGAVIRFRTVMEDYLPPVFTRWEGVECFNYSPLIYARNCENITIAGRGTLDGQGAAWWPWKKLQQAAADRLCRAESLHIPVEERRFGTREAALRPSFLQLIDCTGVRLEDFTILDGPQWTVHPVYCKNVTARGLTVRTKGPNTDGFNPDSCENVLIEDCSFQTGDDCIAVNSGLGEDGWRVNRPCSHVEIRNCRFLGGHAAVAVGSGMSGGVEDLWVHDCRMENVERGIRVKSIRGRGGYVRHLRFENLAVSETQKEAIQVSMNYDASTSAPVSDAAPEFSGFSFRNIAGSSRTVGVSLTGLPESPIRDLTLENVKIEAPVKLSAEHAEYAVLP